MKKFLLLLFVIWGVVASVDAQNRSIAFEQTKEWKQVIKKARKAHKLIFVDCCTSTCPPCRFLAKNVFTLDEVADFFNSNFINAKFDMQKDEDGLMIRKRYQVTAFPTLLFIDPKTEKIVHRMVGNNGAESFMHGARIAADRNNNLTGLMKRYEEGERNPEFIEEYIRVLSAAYMRKELAVLLPDYFAGMDDEHFFTKETWRLFTQNISNPLAPSSRRFQANKEKMDSIVPSKQIDEKTIRDLKSLVRKLTAIDKVGFNEKTNVELIDYLGTLQLEGVPELLAYLYTAEYMREGNYRGMFDKMKEAISYNIFTPKEKQSFVSHFIGAMKDCNDRKLLEETYDWVTAYGKSDDDCLFADTILAMKILLLENLGDKEGVEKYTKLKNENHEKVLDELEKRLGVKLSRD